jgi:hypothetical protein
MPAVKISPRLDLRPNVTISGRTLDRDPKFSLEITLAWEGMAVNTRQIR